jgi:hypothetical protein
LLPVFWLEISFVEASWKRQEEKHLNKLERLSAAAKSFPEFDASQAERDDRRAAWAYRLLHVQGPSAVVRPDDAQQMLAERMTAADIEAIQNYLTMLRVNNLVPPRHGILQNLLNANGAPANAMNLATAQDVYFRGMWMALAQSERRYGGKIVEADDFVDQILKDRVRPVPEEFEMPVERMQRPPMSAPYQVEDDRVREEPDAVDDRIKTMSDLLLRKRSKAERWSTKSKQQATQTFSLLTRFMKEERAMRI